MAYFADLTPYTYIRRTARENELNVGWLGDQQDFPQGRVPEEVLEKIFALCRTPVNQTRGFYRCLLCPDKGLNRNPGYTVVRDGITLLLGSAEIRVNSKSGKSYACPTMIYHYIKDHSYKPPEEFINAVLDLSVPLS